jgi:hypothetical protein
MKRSTYLTIVPDILPFSVGIGEGPLALVALRVE